MAETILARLFHDLPGLGGNLQARPTLAITGLSTDPNLCRPGFLYVADESETVDSSRYGVRLDGRHYIARALENGAVAILTTPGVVLPAEYLKVAEGIPLITHEQPLSFLGILSARFFGEPRPQHLALVTGTNGKTSTVNFCRMLWTLAGLPCCSIGNLGGVLHDGTLVWDRDPTLSVPETVALHHILHTISCNGVDHVAMEATSHAFFDYRLNGLAATVGAFTNLTRDHLDFHQTMDEYFQIKMRLFKDVLPPGSWAVVNADDERSEQVLAICRERGHEILSYGFKGAEVKLLECVCTADGQDLQLEILGRKYSCHLNLFGLFQVSNVLCSLAIVIASGMAPERAVELVGELTEVEGRLNTVAITPAGARAIVDYAHTPDGIRAALEACRSFTSGKLTIVFGCAGESDRGKRAEMGAMAAGLADCVIVTDDQPHHEDPAAIRAEILASAPGAREVAGRAAAVELALSEAGAGDTVLLAGLGHENFQVIGDRRLPYSDTAEARRVVEQLRALEKSRG
ncbi:MAG: UDP-N-acetylmuramoyl-L-alanyl-D-glutamate--2,6-diaminopimelate ligase [Cyanobacteria bacterium SZAS LIN-3]|nr:UDP-N-acetylmuramoyl-L-alanyl-D-glutamate--2,6-diaminopimelate ligase [Cyanobacteria bacterium SZAS LIN-3]